MTAHWTPREHNQRADMLSKYHWSVWEFGLPQSMLQDLWVRFFTPSIDLFTSSQLQVLPNFYS